MTGSAPIVVSALPALTLGIIAYFIGARLTQRFPLLSAYSIPEPVSGGLAAALLALLVFAVTGREVSYDLAARDALLVYFFTAIGLNARFEDLRRGGGVLAIMLVLTIAIMALQSFAGWGVARLFGLPPAAGVMLGTAALVGGHGTAIAWGPTITAAGVPGGAELGIAMATMGLIAASLLGGPIARFLIERHRLSPGEAAEEAEAAAEAADPITAPALMRAILALNLAILAGTAVHELMQEAGIMLPLFVPCLLLGILISNLGPRLWPSLQWPGGGPALALVGEFSLSVFLAMSLMSMALWTLSASAGVLLAAILVQAAAVSAFIILVLFPVLGRNYFAAVMAAGSAGLMIGATPTAIANMNAVTRRYGPAPLAFIVLPLVSAFFIDVLNVAAIQTYLRVLG